MTEVSGLYPAPNFPAFNCTNSTSNATYECADPTATHTLDGFFRRAPVEQVFAWGADQVEISETPDDDARAVVPALELGGEYKFRVAGLYHHPAPPLPPEACDAGLPCGRCLLLLRPADCPTRPDLGRRRAVSSHLTLTLALALTLTLNLTLTLTLTLHRKA